MATGDDKTPSIDADIDMADLASLDAPASSAAVAPFSRFRPKGKGKPKPKLQHKPKPQPEPEPEPRENPEAEPEAETLAAEATAPPEDVVDAMEVDGEGADAGVGADAVEDGGEDFVVREFDVYFTPRPFDEDTMLYIMQYPLRPCWRPYELNEVCKEVRVKPRSSKVEVDLDINTENDNYDPEVSSSLRLTQQTLSSSKAADVADYAVGVLTGNSVYLNHIDAVMQLRPSTSRVNSDQSHNSKSSHQGETNGGTGGAKVPSVKVPTWTPVTVSDSDTSNTTFSMIIQVKGNEQSEGSKDCTEESEPWVSLAYEPAGSCIASKYHTEMTSNMGVPIDFTMSASDYARSLCPGVSTSSRVVNKCHAIREMLLLPLEERMRKWFTEVSQVNRFDALMYLAPTYSEEYILKVLPEYANLVRGLWVCKSSLLFDDGDRYACIRDTILLGFTKMESIPLKDIDRLFKPNDGMKRSMLDTLCKRREKLQDYKFKVAADLSFTKRYSHIVKEQDHAWSVRESTLSYPQETCSNTERKKTKSSAKSSIPAKGPDPNTSKARDGLVQGSENPMHTALLTVFNANNVRSIQAVIRDLRKLAAKEASDRKDRARSQALSNAAKTCASLPHKELEDLICLFAAPVHDVYVLKPKEKASLRNVIIKLFRDKGPGAKLTKQEILDFAKILKKEITERDYHQAVTEICISTEEGHLLLKGGDKP